MTRTELREAVGKLTASQLLKMDTWIRVITHRGTDCLKYKADNEWGWPEGYPVAYSTVLLWNVSDQDFEEAFNRTTSC